jgi:hypothetical protein
VRDRPGEFVALRWTMWGIHLGLFAGVASTSRCPIGPAPIPPTGRNPCAIRDAGPGSGLSWQDIKDLANFLATL